MSVTGGFILDVLHKNPISIKCYYFITLNNSWAFYEWVYILKQTVLEISVVNSIISSWFSSFESHSKTVISTF